MNSTHRRYEQVQENITRAAQSSGRNIQDISTVVVTKGHPIEQIIPLIEAGVRDFGENRVEEALPKIIELSTEGEINWHMIGHLQSRKANLVAGKFCLVHSVDRLKLANRLDRFSAEAGSKLPVLLQYNVSGEQTKSGWEAADQSSWEGLLSDVEAILQCENLQVNGLMTLAPYSLQPETARPFFVRLRKLRDFFAARFPNQKWDDLSMGMSGDYQVAVQEGATIVRIGTAILGSHQG
ncbi:MAG: YggS family pyridoxal phosphate-dependent enzyme [Chloroflexota bacterium]